MYLSYVFVCGKAFGATLHTVLVCRQVFSTYPHKGEGVCTFRFVLPSDYVQKIVPAHQIVKKKQPPVGIQGSRAVSQDEVCAVTKVPTFFDYSSG